MHSSRETKQRDAAVVGSFSPIFLFVYGDDQFAILSVPFQNAMSLDTHESAKPSGVLSYPNSLSHFSHLALCPDLAAASESLLMHNSTQARSQVFEIGGGHNTFLGGQHFFCFLFKTT